MRELAGKFKKIVLWGDNFIARNAVNQMRKQDYDVIGIIDIKYNAIQVIDGVICGGVDSILEGNVLDEMLIIVCVSNALNHETIVKEVIKKGVKYCLYIPMSINDTLRNLERYRRNYMCFINGEYEKIEQMPVLTNESKKFIEIFNDGDYVSFLCPITLLHIATREQMMKNELPGRGKNVERWIKYADEKLDEFEVYLQLFRYLESENVYPEEYLFLQRNNDIERKQLIEDRKRLYLVFEENYSNNRSFFLDSPSRVEYNEKGYFNVTDGLHRIYYLLFKKEDKFPVVIRKKEYEKYCRWQSEKWN